MSQNRTHRHDAITGMVRQFMDRVAGFMVGMAGPRHPPIRAGWSGGFFLGQPGQGGGFPRWIFPFPEASFPPWICSQNPALSRRRCPSRSCCGG